MDKITPAVIITLVVGIIFGYIIHGFTTPKSSSESSIETMAAQSPSPASQTTNSGNPKIDQALSAAPPSLRKDATVMDYPASANDAPKELRKGTNGWTCFPDYPASPGKDPMCVDKNGLEWLTAYTKQQPPSISGPGLAYMLEGGSDASNTDPFAEKPTAGNDWVTSPPHVMVLPSGELDAAVYGTDPKSGGAWIMWDNTPYEHLMVPVK